MTQFHWCDHYEWSLYRDACEEATKLKAALDGNLEELEDNAQKMRDKEQSTENKLLGAAGMGLTGTGMMQTMSAGAEQKADEAAELDMKNYLATMHCSYAPSRQFAAHWYGKSQNTLWHIHKGYEFAQGRTTYVITFARFNVYRHTFNT